MTFLECWRIAHGFPSTFERRNPSEYLEDMRDLLKNGSPWRVGDSVVDTGLDEFDYQRYF